MTQHERRAGSTVLYLAMMVFAAVVLNAYGWYRVFNAAIPAIGGILWVAVFTLAAWGAGSFAVGRWFRSDRPTLEDITLILLSGASMLAATIGLLAVLHVLRPTTVIAVFGLWSCRGGLSLYRNRWRTSPTLRDVPWPWIFVIVVAGSIGLAAATTLAPFYDQWHYHLGFPYQWLRQGTVVTYPRQAYSFFPANMGLLYTYALAGPGGWGAQAIHWWMGALAASSSAAIAGRLGAAVGGRFLAAAAFAATPSVVQMGALAGSDLGVAAFAAASILLILRMVQTSDGTSTLAALAGAAAGMSAGCKYSALATVVVPLGLVAIASAAVLGGPQQHLRRITTVGLAFGIAAAVTVSPWLIRNVVATGNPVHPYMESVFSGGHARQSESGGSVTSGIGTFSWDSKKIGLALTAGTFSRRGRAGDLGPVFLVFVPLIGWWAWRNRRNPAVWVVVGYAMIAIPAWAVGPPLGRYLLPVMAVAAGLIGAAWSDIGASWSRPARSTVTAVLVVVLVANCNPARDQNLFNQIACFLGIGDSDEYIATNCTQIEPFRAANELLPPDALVLLVGEPRPYQIDRDVVVEDQFRTPLLVELANSSASAKEIATRLHDMGVTHIVWNAAEAARIAEAEDRSGYLVCKGPAAQARLDRFLSTMTTSVDSGEWWQILALSN